MDRDIKDKAIVDFKALVSALSGAAYFWGSSRGICDDEDADRVKEIKKQINTVYEQSEAALEALAKAYMDAANCSSCPNRDPQSLGFNQCGKPCNESIKAWALAQKEKG